MKTKSRALGIFAVAFVALFALACLICFAACDGECEHKNVTWSEIVEATCGEDGYRTGTCDDCGEDVTEVLPATGDHSWDDGVVTKEATVDEEGETTYTCTICGETKTEAIDKIAYMADGDVAALSAAVAKTLEYEGSYTCSLNHNEVSVSEEKEETSNGIAKYSYDMSAGVVYSCDTEYYAYSTPTNNRSESFVVELYLITDSLEGGYSCYEIYDGVKSMYTRSSSYSFDPVSNYICLNSLFDIQNLSNLSTVAELNDAMLWYFVTVFDDYGYFDKYIDKYIDENNVPYGDMVELTVSGGEYTMSVVVDEGEVSVSVTVKDGMVTNIYSYIKLSDDEESIEYSTDMDISYSYDASLASNFSDLSQWEEAA